MDKNFILSFNEIDSQDLPRVGGKGANLGEMTKAGFPVPYGFCVTTESYKEFIKHNNLSDFIAQAIRKASLDTITQIGQEIRGKISLSEIPGQVEQSIKKAIDKEGAGLYYAVRSSATAEDLPFASFAGQQDTYLNIKGEVLIGLCTGGIMATFLINSQNAIKSEDRTVLSGLIQLGRYLGASIGVTVLTGMLPEISLISGIGQFWGAFGLLVAICAAGVINEIL